MIKFRVIWNFSFLWLVIGQLSDELANNIFKELEAVGKEEIKNDREKQIVVLSGASEDDLSQISKITDKADTIRNGGRRKHGELIVLDDGRMTKLIQNLKQDGKELYIFMFSTYIPCSDIHGLKFSCAEDLAAFMSQISPDKRYKLIVAFREQFNNTDMQKAMQHLSNGGITLYKLPSTTESYQRCELPRSTPFRIRIFQSEFLTCLSEKVNFQKGIPALVNGLLAECLEEVNLLTGGRRLTFRSKHKMNSCLNERSVKFTQENDFQTKRICEYCILKSLEESNSIGKPRDDDLYCNSWQADTGGESALYGGKYELSGVITRKTDTTVIHKINFKNLMSTSSGEFIRSNVDRILFEWNKTPGKWRKGQKRSAEGSSHEKRSRKRPGSPTEGQHGSRSRERSRSRTSSFD